MDAVELRDFLNDTEDRTRYYTHEYKKIREKKISLSGEAPFIDQTADRIYDIRAKSFILRIWMAAKMAR